MEGAVAEAERLFELYPEDKQLPVTAIEVGGSPVLGKADAGVTIVEFGDFQCPFCAREWPRLKEVLAAYPEDVRVVFKHRPLSFHTKAKPAHAAAELAMREGGSELFWKMYERVVAAPVKLEVGDLREYAKALKMDLARFDKVMADAKEIDKLLEADLEVAGKCNVNATPTVMINGLKLTDRSMEGYKSRIEEALKKTEK
jgi:protein-disulfide isomerase